MSYKSREKKRKAKTAIAKNKSKQRAMYRERRYLTIVSEPCCCNEVDCARVLRPGAEMVFRYEPKEILCLECANRRELRYQLSQRWEQARKQRRRKAKAIGRESSSSDTKFSRELTKHVQSIR